MARLFFLLISSRSTRKCFAEHRLGTAVLPDGRSQALAMSPSVITVQSYHKEKCKFFSLTIIGILISNLNVIMLCLLYSLDEGLLLCLLITSSTVRLKPIVNWSKFNQRSLKYLNTYWNVNFLICLMLVTNKANTLV